MSSRHVPTVRSGLRLSTFNLSSELLLVPTLGDMMATKLTDMPPELLLEIASNLSTKELGDLRGTCRYIESAIFKTFAHEFFHIRWVALLPESVESLVEISNHPQLSQQVSEVKICHEWFEFLPIEEQLDLQDYQFNFVRSGDCKRKLQDAFSRLPNCRTMQIRDQVSLKKRPRDDTNWRAWGIKSFIEKGISFRPYGRQTPEPLRHMLKEIVEIVVEASLPLEELSMITRQGLNALRRHECDLTDNLIPSSIARLATLSTLMLCCFDPFDEWEPIRPFFEALVNLRVLRLNHEEFSMHHTSFNSQHLSEGHDLYDIIGEVFQTRSLKTLQIGKINISEWRLEQLLQSLKSLESLYLFRVIFRVDPLNTSKLTQFFQILQHLDHLQEVIIESCMENQDSVIWKPYSDISDVWEYGASMWPRKIVIKKDPHNPINITELKGRLVIENDGLRDEVERVHMEAEHNFASRSGSDPDSRVEDD